MSLQWSELMLIDKPEGITSFDVIRKLRRIYRDTHDGAKAPKMGHAGTLDPAATGLMLLGVGPGTKKLSEYIKLDKEYVAEIIIGKSTTTADREGEVLESVTVEGLSESQIRSELESMTGTVTLPVSAYSAIKVDGKPMYKRAREAATIGELVTDVPWREMNVQVAELISFVPGEQPIATVSFAVGSGTYIRSLAEELGRRLGYPASLTALRRTKVGEFKLADAQQIA